MRGRIDEASAARGVGACELFLEQVHVVEQVHLERILRSLVPAVVAGRVGLEVGRLRLVGLRRVVVDAGDGGRGGVGFEGDFAFSADSSAFALALACCFAR